MILSHKHVIILLSRYITKKNEGKSLIKIIVVLLFSLLLFTSCSNKVSNISKSDEILEKRVEVNFKEINKELDSFSFEGKWKGSSNTNFLQRDLILTKKSDIFVSGYLQLSYLSTTQELISSSKFDVEIYIKGFEIIAYIKDNKSKKSEKFSIVRDSKKEFRVIPKKDNSLFFENESMMFSKVLEEKSIPIIKKQEKISNNSKKIVEKKYKLVWQDTKANEFIKSTFYLAKLYCKDFKDSSVIDYNWRLPSREEFLHKYNQKLNDKSTAFKYYSGSCYWTNNESLDDKDKAWCFHEELGKEKIENKLNKLNIRCIRDKK